MQAFFAQNATLSIAKRIHGQAAATLLHRHKPMRSPGPLSSSAQDMDELLAHRLLLYQFVARLFGKGLKIPDRAGIGSHHLQQLAAL